MNPNGFQHDFGADEWSYECSACVVYILTLEGETMRKEKQEEDVLTPAPEWVQDELPLSLS